MESSQPIIVRIVEEPVRATGVADVLLGALGLAGALALAALLLGGILGALLIGFKRLRARYDLEPMPDSEALRVTPSSSTS